MAEFLARIRQRKLVRWALAYRVAPGLFAIRVSTICCSTP
jgi:hypothetical protein